MTIHFVVNVVGREQEPPQGGGSWLDYWCRRKMIGILMRDQIICSNTMCNERAQHGGHVQMQGRIYIVPLCPACNHPTNVEPFQVTGDDLVTIE